ncbi:hypothetical protein KVY11_01130 [Acinetobacter sp. CWB-G5]|uniref:hypothetical protein n=1 Tax=Acinetobacter sp. CWB-G5 TaxID=2855444 RepID=UPI001C483568|nr:hypothetical protein [Acinetobacter sp. CWB-G5]MBV7307299.1 hypothetical protein [Acinetobacter sp. CWB-G5]
MAYITKDGKWLAYRDATQEILEYDDFSDVQQVYQPEWFWVDNKDDAKEFHAESIASSFLIRRRGEFWKGAKVANR